MAMKEIKYEMIKNSLSSKSVFKIHDKRPVFFLGHTFLDAKAVREAVTNYYVAWRVGPKFWLKMIHSD